MKATQHTTAALGAVCGVLLMMSAARGQELVQGVVCQAGSTAIRDLAPLEPSVMTTMEATEPLISLVEPDEFIASRPDPVVQSLAGPLVATTLGVNVEGIAAPAGGDRPDATGAVGPFQYVQATGEKWAVFNKSTGQMVPGWPRQTRQLWQALGNHVCSTNESGDVVVRYDELANRWVVSALPKFTTTSYYCVAVSTTHDATGTYNVCAFPTKLPSDPTSAFPDYQKLGVWPDAYYTSAIPGGDGVGRACAIQRSVILDRTMLLSGVVPKMVCFKKDSLGNNLPASLVPSDLDSVPSPTSPPVTGPNYYLSLDLPNAKLNLWKFQVNFTTPGSSTFVGPTPVAGVSSFTPPCNSSSTNQPCVPQPGTVQRLWTVGTRLMDRLVYRSFLDHQSLVVNHSVQAPSVSVPNRTAVRWYEIRNPATAPTVSQSGTFAPDDFHRWMGSIAMDRQSNIAVGYSVSGKVPSPGLFPSIRFTGRLCGDPSGMLQAENTVEAGAGSQYVDPNTESASVAAWGDYTGMSLDPVFECAFWCTNEFLPMNGYGNWHTKIASFRFDACQGCVGDCNRNYQVTMDELTTCIQISLGNQPLANCYRGDGNGDGAITVDEIVLATNYSLNGCPTNGCPTGSQASAPASWQAAPLGVTISQEIGTASGGRGSKVTIPVTLSGGGGTISATQLDILYPTSVLSNPSCVKESRLTNHSLSTAGPADPAAALAGQARLRALLVDLNAVSTFTDGQLFSCTFTIKRTAPTGTAIIRGESQHVSDHAGHEPPSAVTNGAVIVF